MDNLSRSVSIEQEESSAILPQIVLSNAVQSNNSSSNTSVYSESKDANTLQFFPSFDGSKESSAY